MFLSEKEVKWLLSTKAFVITSYVLLVVSLVGLVVGVLNIYPKGEPPVILAISWLALVFSSYGNIISSKVNQKVDKLDANSVEADTLSIKGD